MQNPTPSVQHGFCLNFAQAKSAHSYMKARERHPFNFSISTDILPASNQGVCLAVLVQCSRPSGMPWISQNRKELRKCLLQQVCHSVTYVPKTIQWQIPSDIQQRKHMASIQLEASRHRKASVSQTLWDFLLKQVEWRLESTPSIPLGPGWGPSCSAAWGTLWRFRG